VTGRSEPDGVAELLGEQFGDAGGPADDAVLLRAAAGVDERLDRAGLADVGQHVQEREVRRLGREDGAA
jgi:hypothetical protein